MSMKGLFLAGLVLLAGCAKFPNGGASQNTRVHFKMTVAGRIKPNYIYIVAIRWAKDNPPFDQNRGPIPVIASPWGNGFVAGRANVFMRWDSFQVPNYQMFRFTDPIPDDQVPANQSYLTNWQREKDPIDFVDVPDQGRTIEFDLDMSQIAPTGQVADIKSLQVNFLTMDRIPQGNDNGGKFYDALGNTRLPSGIDDFVTIPVDRNGIYNNTSGLFQGVEITGDVDDPDLDITDWEIQVTLP